MFTLNDVEGQEFIRNIENVLPTLSPGVYYFRDFFPDRTASPRLGRALYENVSQGRYPNITLKGNRAAEGYVVFKKWFGKWNDSSEG